jgi:hypothetical protein
VGGGETRQDEPLAIDKNIIIHNTCPPPIINTAQRYPPTNPAYFSPPILSKHDHLHLDKMASITPRHRCLHFIQEEERVVWEDVAWQCGRAVGFGVLLLFVDEHAEGFKHLGWVR